MNNGLFGIAAQDLILTKFVALDNTKSYQFYQKFLIQMTGFHKLSVKPMLPNRNITLVSGIKALHFSKHKKCASEHQLDKFCMRTYSVSRIRDNERTGKKI